MKEVIDAFITENEWVVENINELEQDVWQCKQIELKVKRLAG